MTLRRVANQNIPRTLDSWNSLLQTLSVALLFLTFAVGAGAVMTSRRIAAREQTRLVNAEQSTAEANRRAAEAAEGTARAAADAASAKERTVKLELEAAQQREKAANAERELFEVKNQIKPRRLDAVQRASLIVALSQANPKGLVTVNCVLGDGEGFAFASQIDDVLKAAGWPTTGVNQGVYAGGANPVGFGILVRSAAKAPPHAGALQHAFTAAGMPLAGAEQSSIDEGTVILLIGNKPQ